MNQHRTEISLDRESDTDAGWEFRITITQDGRASNHVVSMSFHDHDYWCSGTEPPERTARRALRIIADERPQRLWPMPERIDLAASRRCIRDFDDRMRSPDA